MAKFPKGLHPETLALGLGYDPFLSQGSIKPPVFLTSTFAFANAEEGKRFFELAYGLRQPEKEEEKGLIYSRINNPNLQIFEERLAAWDGTEQGATFASGMAAISTTMLGLLRPGDVVLSTAPVYGGTHYLFRHILPAYGVQVRQVQGGPGAADAMRQIIAREGGSRVRVLYVETPANPTLTHTDIEAIVELSKELQRTHNHQVSTVVDNTFLGPVFLQPGKLGVDLVVYSATKFIGGHSDLIAGVVTGKRSHMARVMEMRTILGTMTTPFNGWLLLRSLETLGIRMRAQASTATTLAAVLNEHPKVSKVHHPSLLEPGTPAHELWHRQCSGPGSIIAFEVKGGEKAAFAVLDRFRVARLAVSLGGTETLVEHPMRMTHADVPPEELKKYGVTPGLIRMSVGIEHVEDLKTDLLQALG